MNPASLESSVRHLHSLKVAYPVQYRSALALSSNKEIKSFDAVKLLQMSNHSGPYRKTVPSPEHFFPSAQMEMIGQ